MKVPTKAELYAELASLRTEANEASGLLSAAMQSSEDIEKENDRLTGELDAASARLHEVATLCATVEQERDRLTAELADRNKAVIAQAGNARALADALKTLTQAARISGGVAGADSNLMAACDKAENALSLTGVGCSVNAVLDVIEQRDSLRDEVERLREDAALVKLLVEHGTWHRFRDGPDDKDAYGVIGIRVPYSTILDCIAMRRDALKAALSASGLEGE